MSGATAATRELTVVDSTPATTGGLAAPNWTAEDLDALKQTVCAQLTDAEFRVFLAACRRLGLDPMARQIYALKLDGRMTPQVSIDGFRLISERTGKYAGMLGPYWCGPDGAWREVWLDDKPPAAAKVGILRRDFDQPVWGVARYKSYARNTATWSKFSDVMIAKVAESLARRYAFPTELSGIYTPEEMQQAQAEQLEEHETEERVQRVPAPVVVQPEQPEQSEQSERAESPVPVQPLSMRSLYERAQKLGVTPKLWAELKANAGGDLEQISAKLDQYEHPYLGPQPAEPAEPAEPPGDDATPTAEQLAEMEWLCNLLDIPEPNPDTHTQAELNLKWLRKKARDAGHEIGETSGAEDGAEEPIEQQDLSQLGRGKAARH